MPRSAIDATRFTSTTPHASAKPPPSTNIPTPNASRLSKGGPAGETPQQKVARLRAAAAKARDSKISPLDKLLVHGRVWADRAHRFTALSLIGITFVCGGVTVYAIGDMMIHNRQKRAEFYAQSKAMHQAAISKAQLALAQGIATEDQIDFINRENEHAKQIEERKNKPGLWKRSKNWLFSGLKKEEQGEDLGSSEARFGYEGLSEEDDSLGERESDILRAIEDKKQAMEGKVQQAIAAEKERQRTGGQLDRLGTSNGADSDEPPKSGGWTSFMNIKR